VLVYNRTLLLESRGGGGRRKRRSREREAWREDKERRAVWGRRILRLFSPEARIASSLQVAWHLATSVPVHSLQEFTCLYKKLFIGGED
jgi:hypothetical protein